VDQIGGERGIIYFILNLEQKVAEITKDSGYWKNCPE
jgi:hypothetical protein